MTTKMKEAYKSIYQTKNEQKPTIQIVSERNSPCHIIVKALKVQRKDIESFKRETPNHIERNIHQFWWWQVFDDD